MSTDAPEKAIIYIGVPRGSKGDLRGRIGERLDACRAYAQERGYEILGEEKEAYPDGGPQPALARCVSGLPRHVNEGQGVLIVHDYAGFGYNTYHSEYWRHWLERHNCRVEVVEGDDGAADNPLLPLARRMQATRDECYRALQGARRYASWKYRQQHGGAGNGNPPYGYRLGPDNQTHVPDPAEQVGLQALLELRKSTGWGYQRLAKEMNRRGYPTRKATRWHATTVARILKREAERDKVVPVPEKPEIP